MAFLRLFRQISIVLFSWLPFSLSQKPHILIIVLDDLGSHDLGLHGTGISTDGIDDLARRGLYLKNYYVLPSCSPTRAAIMSGRYPIHTGIHNWISPHSTIGLPLDEETLPTVLRKAGYTAHAVGKWHLGHSSYDQTPTFRGFESFFGFYLGGQDYVSHVDDDGGYDMRFDKVEYCGDNCSHIVDERGNYSTHVFTREAIRVIQQHSTSSDDSPLFLYLAYQAVHAPDEVPPHYIEPYLDKNWTALRKTYAGMLSAADEGIRNVTQALKDSNLWDDTLIIFTTDNGGPTDTCAVQGSSNYPRRGGKCSCWEGGTRGDGFLSGPALKNLGVFPGNLESLFHVVDWLPTLAGIVNATPNGKPLDGVNQLSTLQGRGKPARTELFVGYGVDLMGIWSGPAIRFKQWKLLEEGYRGPPDRHHNITAKYHLYDIDRDSSEDFDIAPSRPQLVSWLKAKLDHYKSTMIPLPKDNPTCPWHLTNTSAFGPAWIPWCDGASMVVVYE